MNWIITADEWVISKYQAVADWVHTKDERISPYLISAQLAGALVVTGMMKFVLDQESLPLATLSALIIILVSITLFRTGMRSHALWKRSKLSAPQTPTDFFLRIVWVTLLLGVAAMFAVESGLSMSTFAVVGLIQDAMLVSSLYFAACKAPTPRFRREERMIPDLA